MGQAAESNFNSELESACAQGFREALDTVRYVLKLKKMGISECEIIKKFQLDPTFIHELMEWMR